MPTIYKYSETNLPTPDEVRHKWCFGMPLSRDNGDVMPDEDIQLYIDGAIKQVERRLGVFLKPTVIACNPQERGLVEGVDYEVAEYPYDYDARQYQQWGFLQLRERPVQEITSLKMVLPNGLVIIDFMTRPEWIKLNPVGGQIQIVPYAGDPTLFALLGGNQSAYPFVTGSINTSLPQMFYVDYVAGFPLNKVPEDVRNVVAKIAACDVLGIAGEALLAGIASMSTSVDGLSESFSTTASATNTTYGAHIYQYKKEIDQFFSVNGGARASTRGITFTAL